MKTKFIIASLGAAVALMLTPAQAAKPKSTDAPAGEKSEKPKKETYPLYGEVVAVTPQLLTIKGGKGKEDRKFDITPTTKIVNGKEPATIADIKVGRKVGGLVKKAEGSGDATALEINVGVKQEAAKKKAEEAAPAKTTEATPPTTTATKPTPAKEEPKGKSKKKKKDDTKEEPKAQ